jgi:predicted MPP superfamily phosphohydrolase
MEYNTSKTQLQIPEYGRIIQQLVEQCKELENREDRNEMAVAIVDFMGQRNPQLRDEANYKHKLWDHLFILASYDLDVDSPYHVPTPEEMKVKPKRMEYPKLQGDFKFYGKSILQLIEKAIELESGDEKDALIQVIGNNMKKSYNVYNKEHVQDEVIFRHLKDLSGNRLDLTVLDSLDKSKIYYATNRTNKSNPRNNPRNPNNRKNFQNPKNRK